MNIEKSFAPKGYRATQLEGHIGLVTSLAFYPCNYRSCWEPAIKKTEEGFFCEKHCKEHK